MGYWNEEPGSFGSQGYDDGDWLISSSTPSIDGCRIQIVVGDGSRGLGLSFHGFREIAAPRIDEHRLALAASAASVLDSLARSRPRFRSRLTDPLPEIGPESWPSLADRAKEAAWDMVHAKMYADDTMRDILSRRFDPRQLALFDMNEFEALVDQARKDALREWANAQGPDTVWDNRLREHRVMPDHRGATREYHKGRWGYYHLAVLFDREWVTDWPPESDLFSEKPDLQSRSDGYVAAEDGRLVKVLGPPAGLGKPLVRPGIMVYKGRRLADRLWTDVRPMTPIIGYKRKDVR